MTTNQKISNLFIEETNFGFALKGNREISGLTTIAIYNTKKEAEIELKKLKKIKEKKFDLVQVNDIVSFKENDKIVNGIVVNVEHNIFTIKVERVWNNNGEILKYENTLRFFKSGSKTNRYHSNQNAIEIIGKI